MDANKFISYENEWIHFPFIKSKLIDFRYSCPNKQQDLKKEKRFYLEPNIRFSKMPILISTNLGIRTLLYSSDLTNINKNQAILKKDWIEIHQIHEHSKNLTVTAGLKRLHKTSPAELECSEVLGELKDIYIRRKMKEWRILNAHELMTKSWN